MVEAGGQHMIVGVLHFAHRGMESHQTRPGGVQIGLQGHHRPALGRSESANPQIQDADLAGALDSDWGPKAAGVARRQKLRCLSQRAEHVVRGNVGRSCRARQLHGQEVFPPTGHGLGHIELVGHEVALHVAQIVSVQPHVGLVQHPLEHQPPPLTCRGRLLVEPVPIAHRGSLAQFCHLPPMPRHGDGSPVRVVKPVIRKPQQGPATKSRNPLPTQLHCPKSISTPIQKNKEFEPRGGGAPPHRGMACRFSAA